MRRRKHPAAHVHGKNVSMPKNVSTPLSGCV